MSQPASPMGRNTRQVIQKSAVPFYAAGVLWLLYAMIFPLYRLWHFAVAAVLSVIVFGVASVVCPKRTITETVPVKPVSTGNPLTDELLQEGRRNLELIRKANDAIPDQKLSAQISHLEEVTEKILEYTVKNPGKTSQVRRFLDYYLPTTLKLLESYRTLSQQGVQGENITSTMQRIEAIMDTVNSGADKLLDRLFSDQALDISSDITVLEQMMAGEGLSGTSFGDQLRNQNGAKS